MFNKVLINYDLKFYYGLFITLGLIRRRDRTSSLKIATVYRIHTIITGSLVDERKLFDITMIFNGNFPMRITVEILGSNTATRSWAIKILDDGTVVSRDSLCYVQFWNGNFSTSIQSCFHNINKSGVLDLTIK